MVRILDFHSSNPDSNSGRRTKKKIGRMVEWLQYQLVTLRGPGSNPGMTAASKSKYFCEVAA